MEKESLSRFGVSIPNQLLKRFDESIIENLYSNRSEAIRDLIREFIVEKEWKSNGKVVGSLTIVYDHDVKGITGKLTEIQHRFHVNVISSMHIHLDKHNCMEVLVIEGDASEVKRISDGIVSSKGVKHGKLVMTTKGSGL